MRLTRNRSRPRRRTHHLGCRNVESRFAPRLTERDRQNEFSPSRRYIAIRDILRRDALRSSPGSFLPESVEERNHSMIRGARPPRRGRSRWSSRAVAGGAAVTFIGPRRASRAGLEQARSVSDQCADLCAVAERGGDFAGEQSCSGSSRRADRRGLQDGRHCWRRRERRVTTRCGRWSSSRRGRRRRRRFRARHG